MVQKSIFCFLLFCFLPCHAELTFFNAVSNSNQFGERLFHQLRRNEGNFAYSPYSISLLLNLIYFSSSKETKITLQENLDYSDNQNITLLQFARILRQTKDPRITVGTSIWLQPKINRHKVSPYIDRYYGDIFHYVNFKDGEKVVADMNNWSSKITENTLPLLVQESNIKPDLRFLPVSLLFLKSNWKIPFPQEATNEEDFYFESQNSKKVKMMRVIDNYFYSESENFFLVEIPFENPKMVRKEISLYILQSKNPEEQVAVEEELSIREVLRTAGRSRRVFMDLSLPIFNITELLSLDYAFNSLGIGEMFQSSANFSKIEMDRGLDKFLHVAPISINEFGQQTSFSSLKKPYKPREDKNIMKIQFNRPFLFFVVDKNLNLILLIGRLFEP